MWTVTQARHSSPAASVQAAMDEVLPATQVTGRREVLEALRAGPLVRGVGAGFVLAVAIAIVYAALATTAALVLLAAVRSRETAHLRTLGMTPRGLLGLSVVEHGPAVIVATAIGVALGVGVAWFVAPGLDLAGLIGSSIDVALVIDWQVVGLDAEGMDMALADTHLRYAYPEPVQEAGHLRARLVDAAWAARAARAASSASSSTGSAS